MLMPTKVLWGGVMIKSKLKRVLRKNISRVGKKNSELKNVPKIPFLLKEGVTLNDGGIFLDKRKSQYVVQIDQENFEIDCPPSEKLYFTTPNLESNFSLLPIGNIISESLDDYKSIQIDYNIELSENIHLSIYVVWYSETVRLSGARHNIREKDFSATQSGKVSFDVPEGAKSLGIAFRVTGTGKMRISHLNVNVSRLQYIDVNPVLKIISEDSDPFIQNAILSGISEYPKLANQPYRLLTKVLGKRNELAILRITTKYADILGDDVYRLHSNALKRLLMMDELVEYYHNLPKDIQRHPLLVSRYMIALNWTSQHKKLHDIMVQAMHYPNVNSTVLANLLNNADLMTDDELETLAEVVKSKNPAHIEFLNFLTFYDRLLSREMISTSQSLVRLLESRLKTGGREGRINYYLMLSNIAFRQKNYADQLHYMNVALKQSKLLKLDLIDEEKPFSVDNITCRQDEDYASKINTDGPLVTIIMTTWNSVDTIGYAVNSILEQTYKNLEVILVDDASSDETPNMIKEMASRDKRIVPVLLKKNGGTYVAKNQGRAIAKGVFVTCQDSDDWAHPEKINMLVKVMIENENLVGVECGHVRISEESGLQRRAAGTMRRDASSLMYRREQIDQALGFYDTVRAGADGEFKFRMQRYFGVENTYYVKDLLSIVAWADGTLSGRGSEYAISSTGVFSAARLAYRQEFYEEHEHSLFKEGKSALYKSQAGLS